MDYFIFTEEFWMETAEITLVVGVLGVIATLVVGFLNNRRTLLELLHQTKEIRTENQVNKEIKGDQVKLQGGQEKLSFEHSNIMEKQSDIKISVNKVGDQVNYVKSLLDKNEGRYENLNNDQKEIRNHVLNLVSNYEKLATENNMLRQENATFRLQLQKLQTPKRNVSNEYDNMEVPGQEL